jgi:hypothetical protein
MVHPDSPAPDGGSVQSTDDFVGDARKDLHQRKRITDLDLPDLGSLHTRFTGNSPE